MGMALQHPRRGSHGLCCRSSTNSLVSGKSCVLEYTRQIQSTISRLLRPPPPPQLTDMLQDPRQESTIIALQELYDQLRSKARPRRPSGLTITDHVGPTKKRASW